jgi:para-aminobenzoate synthetase component 1
MRIENNRNKKAFPFQSHELEAMKLKMLNWLQPFSIFSYLCTNQNYTTKGTYELLIGLAADDATLYDIESITNEAHQDWYFGHIAYTYKSFVEKQLENSLPVFNAFPPTLFFRPTSVIYIERNSQSLVIESVQNPILIYNQIMSAQSNVEPIQETLDFETSESQADYITKIKRIQEHIRMGDCYELNYCVVAQSKLQQTAALQVFASLMQHSPAPFAAYYKFKHQHVLCASPERFLAKTDQLLYSQPIKGTIKRGHDLEQDEIQKNTLSNASKELAEHVMIVDLVRNDLARVAKLGTVEVTELLKVYTFPQVHHLISTIQCQLKEGISFTQIIKALFPMGSMTGAPKIMVMQLIEALELYQRGLFSGSIGYISPTGDFDFNVVIRSFFINTLDRSIAIASGGAITIDSDPQQEWEELKLKVKALESLFYKA